MIKLKDSVRFEVYTRDRYTCQHCGRPAEQIAHRIANTKANAAAYGRAVINHPFNLAASCAKCNDSFNVGNKPEIAKKLAELTKSKLHRLTIASTIEKKNRG